MSTLNQIKAIEKRVKDRKLDGKVYFFDSSEECEEIIKAGGIGVNDICIIDDITND